jgi:hypothetical protein
MSYQSIRTRNAKMLISAVILSTALLCGPVANVSVAEPPTTTRTADKPMSSAELARWIDDKFALVWKASQIEPPPVADDATFLKRAYLDLSGSVPSVSEAREFLEYTGPQKREMLIDQLLNDARRPRKHAERTAAHWATLWRRMMVPGNSQEAQAAVGLEPWLKEQFASNVPYDEMVRKLVTAKSTPQDGMVTVRGLGMRAGGPAMYFQVVGAKPESAASSVTRMFLGVRIGCAECHDHPFAEWKQKDFWGMAAFFSGVTNGAVNDSTQTTIRPANSLVDYSAVFLGGEVPNFSKEKTPRETFADWLVSPGNSRFSATAVNRIWLHLIGRPLTESVEDLDNPVSAEEGILGELSKHFAESRFDLRWLIAGICKSELYQRLCVDTEEILEPSPGLRIVKTLTPEQLFNSLEQALSLPIARADGSARFNGLRDQLISRMNEAASNSPDEFHGGIPQSLLLMNGQLTSDATDLEQSRTLRGVLDAPFLDREQKLDTLYLAVFSRIPRPEEKQFLLDHIAKHSDAEQQKQAYAEIFWGLLNSSEFVLEK